MTKPQQRTMQGRKSSPVKKTSRKRQSQNQGLKWGIGAAVVFVIGVLIWTVVARTSGPPASAVRTYEEFAGITGTSYNAGSTTLRYPDPGKKGKGVQWLPALGAEDAPVVVIEFSDIYCSHCRVYHQMSFDALLKEYVATGKVRYVDHYFGFGQSIGDGAVEAMMCAAEQGKYFAFKTALFSTVAEGALDIDTAARGVGLHLGAFDTCRRTRRYQDTVAEIALTDNMGVTATPTFFVNGEKVLGNRPDEIRRLIEAALSAQ
ncbi:MAG: thioredoxin domain-containing protein [Anaerolineae bacterium]